MAYFSALDWIVIAAYFAVLLAIAIWVIRQKQESSSDYFLAGRNVGWLVIGASIFASNIGSEHLVGLAGAGADSGVAMAHYELHAWCILVLGWVFVPFYSRCSVFTMPEFLERRYSPACRWFLSVISLVAYVLTKISVALYAGGIVFKALFPVEFITGIDNFWLGAVSIVIVTGLYTTLGGLRAVVYTELIQTIVLIVGSISVTLIGLQHLGGWENLRTACGSEYFNLWKPADHPQFPWTGMLLGAPIVGLWYWCTDQYIVQRTLAAANQKQARRGTIFAAYLKLLPVFLFIVPGMIAFALKQKGMIELPKSDLAYPTMVKALLPAGLRGLVVGALLAALMSSLSSVFNSCSTLFTVDIYKKLRKNPSEAELVKVGRLATGAMVVLGLLWIPFMKYISEALYIYLQSVQAYIAPPIFAVFFLGIFSRRINAAGALAGLIAGFLLGMLRLVAELFKDSLTDISVLYWFASINFLHFCLLLLAAAAAVIVGVSLLSSPPDSAKLKGLTFGTLSEQDREESRASWNVFDIAHTIIILMLIASIYIYFTG